MLKSIYIGLLSLLFSSCLWASEPQFNQAVLFDQGRLTWQITSHQGELSLTINQQNPGKKILSYDISECQFCEGEEDNCDKDGVFSFAKNSQSAKDQLAVVCHIGAHSQKIMIFDPKSQSKQPVLSKTGVYFVDYQLQKEGIKIRYDSWSDTEAETPQIKQINWPETKASN